MSAEAASPQPACPWWRVVLIGRSPKWTLVRIVVLVVTVVLLKEYVLLPIHTDGPSMLPTYPSGVNFVNTAAYLFHQPQRGDVVAIRVAERGASIMYVKRIVGMPGETIEFHRGVVFINGKAIPEPYLQEESDWELDPETLGADEYYCVGDNRSMSSEEHTQGRARRERIIGKLLLKRNLSWRNALAS